MGKVVLFDIDYTLFNTDLFRDLTYPRVREILEQEDSPQYHQMVKDVEKSLIVQGGYEPVKFARLITEALAIPDKKDELQELFYDEDLYRRCLYEDSYTVLKTIIEKKEITRGIISKGEYTFQKRKIKPLEEYLDEKNIFISNDKTSEIERIKQTYKDKKALIIDDSLPFLQAIKQQWGSVCVVLIRRENRYEQKALVSNFSADFTITSLEEVLPIVDRWLVG